MAPKKLLKRDVDAAHDVNPITPAAKPSAPKKQTTVQMLEAQRKAQETEASKAATMPDAPPASTLDPVAPKTPKTPKPKKATKATKAAATPKTPKKGGGIYSMDLSPLSPAPTVAPEQGTLPLNLPENPAAPRPRANPFDPTALPKIQTQADLLEALYQAPQAHTGLMGDAGAIGQQRALSDPFPRVGPNAVPSDLPLPRRYGPAGPIPKPPWVPPALNAGPPPPITGPAIPQGPSPLPQRTPPAFRLPQRDPNAAFQNDALRRLDLRAGDNPSLLDTGTANLGQMRRPEYPVGSIGHFGATDYRNHILNNFVQPSNASAGIDPRDYLGASGPQNSMRGMNYETPGVKFGLSDVPGLARGIRNYTSPVEQAVGNFHANTLGPNARLVNPGSLIDRGAQKLPFSDFFNRTAPKEAGWGSGKLGTTLRAGTRNVGGGLAIGLASQTGADIMGADTYSMMADNAKGSGYRAVQGGLGAAAFAGFGSPLATAAVLPGAALGTLGAEALYKNFGWGEAGNITPTDVLSGDNMKREAEVAFSGITDNAMREARGEDVNGNQISGEQALQAKIEATINERNKLTQDYNNSTNFLWTDMKWNPSAAADASAANQLEVAQVQLEDYRERVKQRMGITGETFEQAAQNTEMRNGEDIRTALADPDRQILKEDGSESGVTYGQWLEQSKGQLADTESEPIKQEHYTLDRFRDLAKDAGVYEPYLDEQINQARDQIRLDAISIANSPERVPISMGSETDPMTGAQKPSYMGRDGNPTTDPKNAMSWQEAAQQAGMPVDQYYASKMELGAYEQFVAELPNMYKAGRQSAQDTFQRNALMAQLNQMVPGLMAPYGAIQQYTGNFSDPNQAAAWNNLAALKQQAFQTQLTSGPILAQMEAEQKQRDMMPGGAGYQAQVDQRALQYLIQQEAENQAIANGWYVPKPESGSIDLAALLGAPTG